MGNTPARPAEQEVAESETGRERKSSSVPEFNATPASQSDPRASDARGIPEVQEGSRDHAEARRSSSEEEQTIPTVLKWENGGKNVMVAGTFSNWEKIPMTESYDNFSFIANLPEGTHEYKFYVDGQWIHDPTEPAVRNPLGTYNNVVEIRRADLDDLDIDLDSPQHSYSSSPPGEYGQEMPEKMLPGVPPQLPRLLHQVPLNSDQGPHSDPTVLPTPDHVLLNHLYALSIKDGVMVLATTQRYQHKYVTTLLYKPVM